MDFLQPKKKPECPKCHVEIQNKIMLEGEVGLNWMIARFYLVCQHCKDKRYSDSMAITVEGSGVLGKLQRFKKDIGIVDNTYYPGFGVEDRKATVIPFNSNDD